MFSVASLSTQILLALSITGSPVEVRNSSISLPMAKRLKFSNGTNLMQLDDVEGTGVVMSSFQVHSCVLVGVGTPPTYYNLVVDTGSALTWIGADPHNPYDPTDSAVNLGWPIRTTYGSGSFAGSIWTDTISFDDRLTVTEMPIGVASTSKGVRQDGILGIGPKALTSHMLGGQEFALLTVTDLLSSQGKISQRLVSLYFQPFSDNQDNDGLLTFGGYPTDPDYNIGDVAYTTTTTMPPLSRHWAIDQSVRYGDTEIINATPGIVDCGASFIHFPLDAFERYKAATGAELDPVTNLLTITAEQYDALRPLDFHIGEKTYSLSPNAQIWPRHFNYLLGPTVEGRIFLVIRNRGTTLILGYVFLQRFYSVYDITRSRVGFATTVWTNVNTN